MSRGSVAAGALEQGDVAFDVVFEGIGGRALERAVRALRPGASVILYGASDPQPANLTLLDFVRREGASIVSYFSYAPHHPNPPDLAILADLVDAGRLTPAIAATYPLAEAAAAVKALTAAGSTARSSSPPGELADRGH